MANPKIILLSLVATISLASSTAAAQAPPCTLAGPPPTLDPNKQLPKTCDSDAVCTELHEDYVCKQNACVPYESERRQECEKELARDGAWWLNLQARLRTQIHEQTSREVTTNNRHVVMAYAAIWLIAVAFVVMLWRKQQALRAEIERLSRELSKAEGDGGGGGGGKGAA